GMVGRWSRCEGAGEQGAPMHEGRGVVTEGRKNMRRTASWVIAFTMVSVVASAAPLREVADCGVMAAGGFRPVARERDRRFLAKVNDSTARCRGGDLAVRFGTTPWVDWSNYYATGDASSRRSPLLGDGHLGPNGRGIDGALLDLEYQRIELLKFNLFENSGTFRAFVQGREGVAGPALKT